MKKVLVLVATFFFCAGGLLAQSQQAQPSQREESLGEVARKLREKKAKPAAAKVYTNDDLEKLARGRISVVGQPGAAPAATTAAPEGQPAAAAPGGEAASAAAPVAGQQGEQYWRGKFAEARGNIVRAEQELDILQRELNLTRMQFNQDPNQAMRQQYLGEQAGGKVAELLQKIQAKQAELEQLRTAFTNLENDLRRSGGSPGWARP